jgi:glutathione synthase/RimK-type ligase-like ATP-grasp enzyme
MKLEQVPILIVVTERKDWPLHIENVEIVEARTYLTDPRYAEMRRAKVFNLCRSYRYQNYGYYVSLVAAARGHKPLPNIATIQDLKSPPIVRVISEDLDELIQKSLSSLQSKEFVLSIYFGRNLAHRYDRISFQLFRLFQSPFLRAVFIYSEKSRKWQVQTIGPIAASEVPEDHRTFIVRAATDFFRKQWIPVRQKAALYDLAILVNPSEQEPPSNQRALQRFEKAAEDLGFDVEFIDKDDYGRIPEFDALFIRETTSVNHHTFRFARRASAEGIVVLDDPESILKCTNKVFLAELLDKNNIPTLKTFIVHRKNVKEVSGLLGFPCVLKRPDSSFSQGVLKADNEKEFREAVEGLLERSDLIIAQEFMPTTYDWRVGVIDRQPLYVCKYFMAKKHWQVIKRDKIGKKTIDGESETLAVEQAPPGLIRLSLRAANLVGDGFYGLDIKQVGKKFYVIEINDNPSIDAGVEDLVLRDELYMRIMRVFLSRLRRRTGKREENEQERNISPLRGVRH